MYSILGVTFDSKLTLKKHLRSVSRAASQRLGILRKSWRVFHDRLLIGRCFWGFVLPVLEYCSVAVLCMLYKIRCNPMHPLCGTLPVPYVPVRVTRSALIEHRYTYVSPHCRTSQYLRTFIPLSVSLWNDLVDPMFDGVVLAGFKSR